jgi:hypothetical protein
MSPDSQGLFELGDNIEKYTGLSLKDAKKYNESPDDAYIYGLVNTMNDGQDIFFFNNGMRLAGKAKELGAWPAVIEQLAHEGLGGVGVGIEDDGHVSIDNTGKFI